MSANPVDGADGLPAIRYNVFMAGEKRRTMKGGWVVIVLIVAAILVVKWPLFDDGVRVYIGVCAKPVKAESECQQWSEVYEPATYIATSANQQVIVQVPNGGMFKLPSCVVRDKNNWACEDTPSGTPLRNRISMVDGDYLDALVGQSVLYGYELTPDTLPNSPKQTAQLPRWKWLYLRYIKSVQIGQPVFGQETFYGKPMFKD